MDFFLCCSCLFFQFRISSNVNYENIAVNSSIYDRTQKYRYTDTDNHTMSADCDWRGRTSRLRWAYITINNKFVAIFSSNDANHDNQSLNTQKEWIAWGARQSLLIYSIYLGVYLSRIGILSIAKSLSNANSVAPCAHIFLIKLIAHSMSWTENMLWCQYIYSIGKIQNFKLLNNFATIP